MVLNHGRRRSDLRGVSSDPLQNLCRIMVFGEKEGLGLLIMILERGEELEGLLLLLCE
jgi:hypothetical protein